MFLPMTSDPHEVRSGTILRHVQAFLRDTGTSDWTYAQRLVDVYHARTPASHRTVSFRQGGDPGRDMKTNAGHVARFLVGAQRLPVDLEDAMVLAMPEERARACWVDLAARVGRMSIAHPEDGVRGVAEDLGRLTGDVGGLLTSLAPLLDDLAIDHNDALPDLLRAREKARALSSQVHTVIEQLSRAVQTKQCAPGGPPAAVCGKAGRAGQ